MFNLIPWRQRGAARPRTALSLFGDDFDALFDRLFSRWAGPLALEGANQHGWGLEMQDEGKEYVIRAEAPGFEVEDFDVQVQEGVVTIRAERKREAGEKKDPDYSYSERRLERTLTLPGGVDPENVQANYRNGVLELHLAKRPEARAQRIEVKKA